MPRPARALTTLRELLGPDLPEETLQRALAAAGGDASSAANLLFEGKPLEPLLDAPHDPPQQQQHAGALGGSRPAGGPDRDARAAPPLVFEGFATPPLPLVQIGHVASLTPY
jgi:hypothetical protein